MHQPLRMSELAALGSFQLISHSQIMLLSLFAGLVHLLQAFYLYLISNQHIFYLTLPLYLFAKVLLGYLAFGSLLAPE